MRQRRETLPHRFYMVFQCDAFFSATRSVVACRASVLPQSRETQARAEVASIGEAAPSPARDLRFSVRLAPLSRIGRACCLKGKRRAVAASRARGRGSLSDGRQWSAFFNRYSALCLSSRDTSRSEAELRSSFYGAVCADTLATGSTGEPYGRAHSERSERLYEACPARLRSALAFGLGPYSQDSVFTKVVESEGQVI